MNENNENVELSTDIPTLENSQSADTNTSTSSDETQCENNTSNDSVQNQNEDTSYYLESDGKLKKNFKKLKKYWKVPAEGRYMPIKEIAAYGVGGMGIQFFISYISLAFGASMLQIIYGLTAFHATTITIIVALINLVIMPFLYRKFDTVESKRGKFRTFIGILAPILAAFIMVASFVPQFDAQGKMIYAYLTVIPTLLLSGMIQNIYTIMPAALTPNSQERSDMLSPASLIYSLSPTVLNFIFNPIRGIFQKMGKEYLAFRIMGIVFAILGLFLTFIIVKWTKEKVFVTQKKVEKIDTIKCLKEIGRNKAFVLLTLFNVLGPLKILFDTNMVYLFDYRFSAETGTGNILSSLIGLTGEFATISMVAIPFILRKLKKRDILIGVNLINGILLLILAAVGFEQIPIGIPTMAVTFILKSIMMFNVGMIVVIMPSITCELYDQQQVISGDRLVGLMSTVTGYVAIIGVGLTLIPALIQGAIGFNPGLPEFRPGDAAYNPDLAVGLATKWLTITAWIGGGTTLLGTIPLFFYKLTEEKHKQIIEELKLQAADYQLETGEVHADGIDVLHNAVYDENGNVIEVITLTEEDIHHELLQDNDEISTQELIDELSEDTAEELISTDDTDNESNEKL